jgi:hypothetical protein
VYLDTLSSWVERNRADLESRDVTVRLSDRSMTDKPAQVLTLSRTGTERQLTVWASGECDVMAGDVATGDVEITRHDLASEAELLAVLDGLLDDHAV